MKETKRNSIKTIFKVALLGASALTAVGVVNLFIPPDKIPFDASKSYEPTAVQKEFIRLNAQQFKYLAFGDTNHMNIEHKLFSVSNGVMSALRSAGVKNYFIETSYQNQPRLDAARDAKQDYPFYSSWICNQEARDTAVQAFKKSVTGYKDIRFVAADARFSGEGYAGLAGAYRDATLRYPTTFYYNLHGCWSGHAFALSYILNFGQLMGPLTDDTATANRILSFPGKGAIFYGAAHFEAGYGTDKSMRGLLAQNSNTIAVINIFKNASSENQDGKIDGDGKKPDAVFYVDPPEDAPDGIKIVNPAFNAVYEQAKKNVAATAGKLAMR